MMTTKSKSNLILHSHFSSSEYEGMSLEQIVEQM